MNEDNANTASGLVDRGDNTNDCREVGFDLDPSKYASEIAEFNLSDEQQKELLTIIWSIMRSFVEMGFEGDICGRIFANLNLTSDGTGEMVDSASPNFAPTLPENPRGN